MKPLGHSSKTKIKTKCDSSCIYSFRCIIIAIPSFYVNIIVQQMSHIIFLALFSYVLLVEFKSEVTITEYVLIGWVGTLAIETIRQVRGQMYFLDFCYKLQVRLNIGLKRLF